MCNLTNSLLYRGAAKLWRELEVPSQLRSTSAWPGDLRGGYRDTAGRSGRGKDLFSATYMIKTIDKSYIIFNQLSVG